MQLHQPADAALAIGRRLWSLVAPDVVTVRLVSRNLPSGQLEMAPEFVHRSGAVGLVFFGCAKRGPPSSLLPRREVPNSSWLSFSRARHSLSIVRVIPLSTTKSGDGLMPSSDQLRFFGSLLNTWVQNRRFFHVLKLRQNFGTASAVGSTMVPITRLNFGCEVVVRILESSR
jgi:hypothetical protein